MAATPGGPRICRTGFLVGFPTELVVGVGSSGCCKLHKTIECGDREAMGCRRWVPGTHHAIAGAYAGTDAKQLCFAEERVLAKDRQFARVALEAPRLASYLYKDPLAGIARFLTGDVVAVSSFGAGYCSLQGVRTKGRMRSARVLGPAPLVADVLRVFNVVGDCDIGRLEWVQVAGGLFHIRPGRQGLRGDSAISFFSEGLRILKDVGPYACVGVSEEEVNELVALSESESQFTAVGKKGKAACSRCGKVVDPRSHLFCVQREMKDCSVCGMKVVSFGHEARCVVPLKSEPAAELIGDALHALDVKVFAVMCAPVEELTQFTIKYVRAEAQRSYLEEVGIWLGNGLSDHSWGSEFERRYHGGFRMDYIRWLVNREAVGELPDNVSKMLDGYRVDSVTVHQLFK